MDSATERITLPDGGWWEVRSILTRGMRKKLNEASLKALGQGISVSLADPEALKRQIEEHPEKLDINSVDDAMLLMGTVAYSYGSVVDLATIDDLPDGIVQKVLERMRELYAGMDEKERADFFVRR